MSAFRRVRGETVKHWIFPAVALGTAVFLMTRQGRDLQDRFASSVGDWCDDLIHSNRVLQSRLAQVQSALEQFNHALHEVGD